MTPGARVAAAIEVLDAITDGAPAEQALTRWARRSRFAGSKDRAAIRDHVFDALRCRRTAAHYGRGTRGRALMIGTLHAQAADLDALFSGDGHAPAPLTPEELELPDAPTDQGVSWNLPDWLLQEWMRSLGDAAADTAQALQERAPVFLRINSAKVSREDAAAALTAEGILTKTNPLATNALTIVEGARKLRQSAPYLDGRVELQDAASQAVVEALPKAARILDYCAGGGGKTLALAAQGGKVFAHDADPRRMVDLPKRAVRAGAEITQLATMELSAQAPFDIVLCDAPCSGSGAWRRAPDGKWALTAERLSELIQLQDQILDDAAVLIKETGTIAYATCSVLRTENEDRIAAFCTRHPDWRCTFERRFGVGPQGDGFYTAHLMRE